MASQYNISSSTAVKNPITTSNIASNWASNYKDTTVNFAYDASQFGLVNPDDCLLFIGPPRMEQTATNSIALVGTVPNFSYSESANIQPIKAMGSRLHMFARSNVPVQAQLARLVFYGPNVAQVLYSQTNVNVLANPASKLTNDKGEVQSGELNNYAGSKYAYFVNPKLSNSGWWGDLSNDLFRIPFGLGVVYNSPGGLIGNATAGADYLEMCSMQSRSVSIQAGGGMVMENVTIMADRVLPWKCDAFQNYATVNSVGTMSSQPAEDTDPGVS